MICRFSKYLIISLAVLSLVGCSTKPTFYIELQLPGQDVSCQAVDIEFLSYNYPSVLDSLVKINKPGSRPDSTELMVLLANYQDVLDKSARMADSVDRMREALEKMDHRSVTYRKQYPLFQRIEKQMTSMLEGRHQVHQQYIAVKSAYGLEMRQWRGSAYKGFGDFKTAISPELQTKVETTDRDCMVRNLQLPYGHWWLHAEARKPGTTNELLVWDIELPADGDSVNITLSEDNARIQRELL